VVTRIKRLLKIAGGVLAFLVYVWFASVRSLPLVKWRKRARSIGRSARAAPPR
jgi:hypothetical protein